MADNIIHTVKNGVTFIHIEDGDNGNRVSDLMASEMTSMIDAAPKVSKAIVLTTSGEDFCLGRAVMGEKPGKLPEAYVMRDRFDTIFDFYDSFRRCSIPVIGRVQGKAVGFGCAMAALTDITIAADTSLYQLPETTHRIMPTMAMSSLIDRVGRKAITYLTYSGDFIDAHHALAVGMISQVVPEKDLDQAINHIVERVTNIPLAAVHAIKEFATYSIGLPMPNAEQYARNLHATINSSEALREQEV